MKLPRDLSGAGLVRVLRIGYRITRQTGSHLPRLIQVTPDMLSELADTMKKEYLILVFPGSICA
jgi:hypothetical protein